MKLISIGAMALLVTGIAGPAAAADWNGFYAGILAGYSSVHSDASYDSPDVVGPPAIPFSTFDLDSDPTGGAFGVTLGYNADMGTGMVLGLEGDVSFANVSDTIDDDFATYRGDPGNTITSKTDLSGTLRGQIGFTMDNIMPYLTAGFAVANVDVTATDGDLSDSATLWGWTAGAGVEVALTNSISVKAEYLYTDLGEHTWFDGELWSSTSHSTSNTVRVGLNFAFD